MKGSRGITFIETFVWIGVFTVAMLAVTSTLLSFYRANTYTLEQAQAVSEARRSIERVVGTLREATFSNEGAYPVVSIAAGSITFYADIDADPVAERVRYFVEGTELKQGIIDPTGDPPNYAVAETISTVAYFVRNISQNVTTFRYYDAAGVQIADMNDVTEVRFIRIDTVVNVSPDKLPNELTMRSSATFRNLR